MLKRVYLEITNACNLNCPFCTYEKGNYFLSLEKIKDTLDQIRPYCEYIYLHMLGEPLLHPEFKQILDYLDLKDFKLQLVTNGTLLHKYPDILNHKCLRKLSISIHSINNIDVDDNYFETINTLIEKNLNSKIELRFYNFNNLSDKLLNYLNAIKSKYNFELTSKNNSYKLKDNTYIYFEELFKWPNINDEYIGNKGTCHGAIDMIAINSNLDLTICCLDPKAYNSLGNLKEKSLKEILESKEYKQYIDEFKKGLISSPLCQKCSYRLKF